MKIVYVLTSDVSDYYLEQVAMSIYSLRLHNPLLPVEIVIDKQTHKSIDTNRSKLLTDSVAVTVIDVSNQYNKMQRSRWLKTNLRNLIEDDFLFIDTDTVICGEIKFDALPNIEEMCAVKDLHINIIEHAHKYDIISRAKKIEWQLETLDQPYHNSGVLWVKDTLQTRNFYKDWNEEWKKSAAAGCSSDQPSLCKVNKKYNNFIKPLDDKWNCQISENGLRFLNEAIIIHYFASGKTPSKSAYIINNNDIYKEIRENGITDKVSKILLNPKSAFYHKLQLISDQDVDFYNSPLCRNLKKLFYSSPSLYNRIIWLGRKFKST